MRRFVCITMMVLFLFTIVSGILEAHMHPGRAELHTGVAILFIVSALTHAVVNRKPLARYLTASTKKAE